MSVSKVIFPKTNIMKNMNFFQKCKCKRLFIFPFLRKIDTQISLVIYAIVLFGCNNYPVYYTDPVESEIEIIGKETCNPEEEENLWLVNVESTIGPRKMHGIKAVIGEKKYDNIVKTKFDFSEYDRNVKYYILTVSEFPSVPYPCLLPEDQLIPSNVKQIQMITIHHLDTKPRSL